MIQDYDFDSTSVKGPVHGGGTSGTGSFDGAGLFTTDEDDLDGGSPAGQLSKALGSMFRISIDDDDDEN